MNILKVMRFNRLLLALVILRIINVFLVQTWFVPDEYWQSLEVAHKLVFGYGFLTWEWKVGVRSYFYPLFISLIYYIIEFMGMSRFVNLLIVGPRIIQAISSAFAEYYYYKFIRSFASAEMARWSLLGLLSSWFWWFCATRTLINSIEASFVCFALYFFPWKNSKFSKKFRFFVVLTVTATVMRPTSATVWIPLYFYFLYQSYRRIGIINFLLLITRLAMLSFVTLMALLALDRFTYGDWRNVLYNFLRFNLLENRGIFYGAHPWHWYMSQGLFVVLGTHIVFVIHGMWMCFLKPSSLTRSQRLILRCSSFVIGFTIVVYSMAGHKEFRFILSLLPCFMIYFSISFASLSRATQRLSIAFILATNIPVMLYTGLIHQAAPLQVMRHLRTELTLSDSVLFLLPCHSTPYYSHLHVNTSMRFLTCEPDFEGRSFYMDEADTFYKDPQTWLRANIFTEQVNRRDCAAHFPRYIVLYDVLWSQLQELLTPCYEKQVDFFHSHFPDGVVGEMMIILSRR